MKIKLTIINILAFSLFLTVYSNLFAQAPDTVTVPDIIDDDYANAINKFILGDTTESGERNNINRVYRLERGKFYFVATTFEAHFPLRLIADDDDPENPTAPPVIAPWILQDGTSPVYLIRCFDDASFKNIYITAILPSGEFINWSRGVRLYKEHGKYEFDNCVFEGWGHRAIQQVGEWAKVYIRDCHFRNAQHPTSFMGGAVFGSDLVPTDTVVMTNNTMFNCGAYFFLPHAEITNYSLVEHNTIFTNHSNIFHAPYLHNSYYRNNIIFGVHTLGQSAIEIESTWYDWDKEISSIVSIDTIATDIADREGIEEKDRIVRFENNAYFWPQQILDFWANPDRGLAGSSWMNSRTQAMDDDDVNYPGFVVEGNLNVDPGFNEDMMALVDSLVAYATVIRDELTPGNNNHLYLGEGQQVLFPPVWPLPEDLTYSNTELLTAGTDGLPLGDLNWYPDKRAEWENIETSIETVESKVLPADFLLYQNFPNPFNPETTIKFSLKKNADIKLVVYNMLGQKVRTLIDKKMTAGSHSAIWNGQDDGGNLMASGIYYYRLESDAFSLAQKMVLVK